jgi:hypothetical protein
VSDSSDHEHPVRSNRLAERLGQIGLIAAGAQFRCER